MAAMDREKVCKVLEGSAPKHAFTGQFEQIEARADSTRNSADTLVRLVQEFPD